MAGKKFAAEFALRRNVSAQDKILIQDSDDDVVKYAYPPQIASLSGYAYAQSVADLPLLPSNKSIGYIVGQMLYIYVGMGGDTKDGLYQSVGFFVGPQGVQGEKGEKGEQGEQGVQGPKGDNGGLSLQELDDYLATKQYVTGDTLADMLAGYVSNTSLMRDYVTIAKAQDVTGVKNFTAGVQFGGLPMYKSKADTVYLDANLVVRGAVTMYGMNTTTSPSIFSTLPIDGTTIGRNEKGELYVIGGTSGGGGVADFIDWSNVTNKPTWITDTKPKYSYSEILDTPDLSVYAIKSSVDNALSGKADKATTLAGYGITNAYTKSEVNNIIDSLDDTYVTIAGEEQSITAEHNFVNGFKVGGLPIKKSQDKTLYLDANLVVSGAITMYGSDSTTFPTIWASIPFDSTMKWDGSKWSVVGNSGSGSGLDYDLLDDYLTINGYATQDWVTGNGYITSDALEPYALKSAIPTNTNQLTNGAGFITGITLSMVTNALGYTPLSTGGGTITGEVTISCAANTPLKINSNATDSGIYFNHNGAAKTWVGFEASRGSVLYHSVGSHRLGINNDGVAFYDSNTLLHAGNYSDYALPKDGTAVAATTLKTSTGFLYTRTYDSSRIVNIGADATAEGYSTYIDGMFIRFRYGSAYTTAMQVGVDGNVAIGGTTASEKLHVYGNLGLEGCLKVVKSTYPDIRGNGSYLTLSPDDVAGSKGSVGLYKTGNSSYEFRRVWDHHSYGSMNLGSSSNRWTTVYGVAADFSGDIVGNNILAKGAITMYYSSDKRLKQNIRKVDASKTLLSLGGVFQYEYINDEVAKNSTYGGSHYGLIYQNVKGTALSTMCHEREDGMGALNYLDTNFISLIAGATMENISEVEKLKRKIRTLENKVKQLERVA